MISYADLYLCVMKRKTPFRRISQQVIECLPLKKDITFSKLTLTLLMDGFSQICAYEITENVFHIKHIKAKPVLDYFTASDVSTCMIPTYLVPKTPQTHTLLIAKIYHNNCIVPFSIFRFSQPVQAQVSASQPCRTFQGCG